MASSRSSGRPEPRDREPPIDEIGDAVRAALSRLRDDAVVVLAFSGGIDSMVLLDALARCRPAQCIVAWHVHHGLQPRADDWLAWCEREAHRCGVRFGATRIAAPEPGSGNVEGWARRQRYAALWKAVADCEAAALLTAHHADDQLETVVMRLARGSGPEALGGMAPAQRRAGGWLLRPLLGIGRERIVAHAHAHRLPWLDDPMNRDERFVRVALRERLLPGLAKVFPSLRENVLRSAELIRESGEALEWLARADLHRAADALEHSGLGGDGSARDGFVSGVRAVDRRGLATLPRVRRDRAVRAWMRELGATMPNRARLEQWIAQMLLGASASAEVVHDGWRFRRYRNRIEVERDTGHSESPQCAPVTLRWRGEREVALPQWGGRLRFESAADGLDAQWLAAQPLEVRAARSGSRLRPIARAANRTVKNLFQERGVPPWVRKSLPALHAGDRLLYVAGLGMNRDACDAALGGARPEQEAGAARVAVSWLPDDAQDPRAAWCVPRASV